MKSKMTMEHWRNDADSTKTCTSTPFPKTCPTRIGPVSNSQCDLNLVWVIRGFQITTLRIRSQKRADL